MRSTSMLSGRRCKVQPKSRLPELVLSFFLCALGNVSIVFGVVDNFCGGRGGRRRDLRFAFLGTLCRGMLEVKSCALSVIACLQIPCY